MPRLLLVAYHFPPEPTAAAVRLGQVAANLPKFGWHVSVLSRPSADQSSRNGVTRTKPAPAAWTRARRRYHDASATSPLKRAARMLLRFGAFPDRSIWWVPVAVRAALQSGERYDAVMSSYWPSAGHFIGWQLSRGLGIPWIVDYQDLWTGNGTARVGRARKQLARWLERRLVRRAAVITCCKESFAQTLRKIHGGGTQCPPVESIPFACDREAWSLIPDVVPSEFSLCYAGSFYPGHSSPDLLFQTIASMRAHGSPAGVAFRFDYFGQSDDHVLACARRHGLRDIVRLHGCVSRQEVMRAERAAAALVTMFEVGEAFRKPWLPSKLFEYAGAKRHLLGIGPADSAVEDFIARNGLGLYASDQASCADAIERLYRLFSEERFEPNSDAGTRLWSPVDVAERFATILNRLIGANYAGFRGASLDSAEAVLHL